MIVEGGIDWDGASLRATVGPWQDVTHARAPKRYAATSSTGAGLTVASVCSLLHKGMDSGGGLRVHC